MRLKFLLYLFFVCSTLLSAQNITEIAVVSNNGTKYIPVYDREGTIYFSVTHFADALYLNYFLNPESKKIEIKFPDYYLKITAQNPYIVLTDKTTNQSKTIQLPTSSYFLNNNIYIPLKYCIDILSFAMDRKLEFQDHNKLIVKREKSDVQISFNDQTDTTLFDNISPVNSYNISNLQIEDKANGTLVRVVTDKRIPSYASSFKDDVLTIIFRGVNADVQKLNHLKTSGLIERIRVRNIDPDTELKFKLSSDYTTNEVLNADSGNDILITLHNKVFSTIDDLEKNKERWNFDVVVLDPGHGGRDPGAIGIGGIKEKNINLGIALKLGKLIEKDLKDVKVVYTRKTDKFVELYKRGQIANQNNGKLFISIHCNSTPRKPTGTEGITFYLLRPGRTKEAVEIAETENSVIKYEDNPQRYQKLTDENFILVTMAHSAFMKYSEKFSELLNQEFDHNKSLDTRGVKQAGFYVLVGASMPSVLIETGFISNRHDAAYLKSRWGQEQVAKGIFEAIKKYKESYDKVIQSEL